MRPSLTVLCHNQIGSAFQHARVGLLEISTCSNQEFVSLVFQDDQQGLSALQPGEIGEILRTPGRHFVAHEFLFADGLDLEAVEANRNAGSPCLLPCHSADAGEQVDAVRCAPQLNDLSGHEKVIAGDSGVSESKGLDHSKKLVGVFGRYGHHQIDVLRKAWCTVKRERVAADEEEINFPREAQSDELSDALVQCHWRQGKT